MANKFIVLSSRKLRGAWLNFSRGHSFFNSWRIILIQKLDHPVPQEVRIQFQRWNQDCKLYRSFKRKHFVFCQHFCMKNTFPVTISATYSSKRSVLLKIIGIINIWVQLQDIGEKVGLLPSFRHNRMFSLSWVHESIDRGKLSIPQEILNYCKWNLRFYYHPSGGKSKKFIFNVCSLWYPSSVPMSCQEFCSQCKTVWKKILAVKIPFIFWWKQATVFSN